MVNVALYGINGHQVIGQLVDNPRAVLKAYAGIDSKRLADAGLDVGAARECASLEDILAESEVDLVVLCSERRVEQGGHAIKCLQAGKHVYAEKPCAFTNEELDEILAAAEKAGKTFHDMAGSALEQPYWTMREIVASGKIGEVVQVFAQKSYPYHDRRPQDEDVDGGLLMQVGVHAMRFIEHVCGLKARVLDANQTRAGNPKKGDLRMACSINFELENGALATLIANYCNSGKFGTWGNEHLRVFGTKGFVESTNGGRNHHLYLNDEDCGELEFNGPSRDYFEVVLDDITGVGGLPFTLEEELHPTRVIIEARAMALVND